MTSRAWESSISSPQKRGSASMALRRMSVPMS